MLVHTYSAFFEILHTNQDWATQSMIQGPTPLCKVLKIYNEIGSNTKGKNLEISVIT